MTRSDTGAPLPTGKLVSSTSVGSTPIRHAGSFRHGRVRLSLRGPEGGEGQELLRVKLEVTAAGQTALGIYTYTVR